MTQYRRCALGLVPPTKEIFGQLYGQCALAHECPTDVICAYANWRRLIEEQANGEIRGAIRRNRPMYPTFAADELNLIRQWYNAVEDLAPGYLADQDRKLMRKIRGAIADGQQTRPSDGEVSR